MRTQPSLRPRTRVEGAVRPITESQNGDSGILQVRSMQTIFQSDTDEMRRVNLLEAGFLPGGQSKGRGP